MIANRSKRVLIIGGGTYLGVHIAAALLDEGAEVTVIIREGNAQRLGGLQNRLRVYEADVWDPASLKGRARGHNLVIHTVGSMTADPATGLTYERLNVVSARNAANMCVSDGVPHFLLLSSANAPWIHQRYIRAKRQAERYVRGLGVQTTIVRAPLTYVRGRPRPLFYRLISLLGVLPPFRWLPTARAAPIPLDAFARGVARIGLASVEGRNDRIVYARELRKLSRITNPASQPQTQVEEALAQNAEANRYRSLDESSAFGWTPSDDLVER